MFGGQRLQIIRQVLLEEEFADVQKLSEQLQVSEVTIRRDLEKLEKEGFVVRKYGGAVLNKDYADLKGSVLQAGEEEQCNDESEELISQSAADMIDGDESVFLGYGNISRGIARNLGGAKRLVVITNDIYVAQILDLNPAVKVTVTGGNMLRGIGAMAGPVTLGMIRNIFINKSFIELKGVHIKFGYTMESHEEVEIVKGLYEVSNEVIGMATYKRFGTSSLVKLGDLGTIPKIISNKEIPEEYKRFYYSNGIKLFTTYDIK